MSEAHLSRYQPMRPPPEKLPGGSPRASFPEDPWGYGNSLAWMSRYGLIMFLKGGVVIPLIIPNVP